jgi:hypothetical protein
MIKDYLTQSGVTLDSKPIISGIYQTFETHGIPLEIILSILKDKDAIPNWIDLYKDCRLAGIKHDRVLSRLEEAINDSYGKEFSEHILPKLDKRYKHIK